jgi:hypothetical protein
MSSSSRPPVSGKKAATNAVAFHALEHLRQRQLGDGGSHDLVELRLAHHPFGQGDVHQLAEIQGGAHRRPEMGLGQDR